ncbi:MAG: hypothetical protein ACI8XO_004200 [Verrucomicrobiales bacterium]|jgi:hypothetical protein
MNDDMPGSGAAYVFVRSGGTWVQQAFIKASNAGAGDYFGRAALSGDTIVVGADTESGASTRVNGDDNDGAAFSGAAYVFVRSGSVWSHHAYLKASNTGSGDGFGRAVGVSGDMIVVGASGEAGAPGAGQANNSADSAGAAYLFDAVAEDAPEIMTMVEIEC